MSAGNPCSSTRWLCIVLVGFLTLVLGSRPTSATTLPAGFTEFVIAGRLSLPTTFAFLPDCRILMGEKEGAIKLARDGHLRPDPLLTIAASGTLDEDGLVAMTISITEPQAPGRCTSAQGREVSTF